MGGTCQVVPRANKKSSEKRSLAGLQRTEEKTVMEDLEKEPDTRLCKTLENKLKIRV